MNRLVLRLSLLLTALAVCLPVRAKIVIEFDYSLDGGFFTSHPEAKTTLDKAAKVYTDRILDTLTAITPGGSNTWNATINHPSTGTFTSIPNLSVAANVVKIYVGARTLPSGTLAVAGPGGYNGASGTQAFSDAVRYRGQAGAALSPPTDFGRWGGMLAFDNTRTWNYDLDTPTASEDDFLTVAIHELAHVLGQGTSTVWNAYLTGTLTPFGKVQYVGPFTGPKATALYGGSVPLETPPTQANSTDPVINAQHTAPGLTSTVGGVSQAPILGPNIPSGTRRRVTLLDWAIMDDLGWDLAMAGDANADGSVNFSDLTALAANYGGTGGWAEGDFNEDGMVSFHDLTALAANYGLSGVAASEPVSGSFDGDWALAQAQVPEPGALSLLVGALPWLGKRRRPVRGHRARVD